MTQQNKKIKRPVNGILLLDKSIGVTSNKALQEVKHLFCALKAGHTGSLDPLASGMLPICFGEATKFSHYLLSADKTYHVKAQLGIRTETGDMEGKIIAEHSVKNISLAQLDHEFSKFRGEISQVPSMYSALKYQGQPLYKLARQGITVERPARSVHIYELTILSFEKNIITFSLRCSKGTYVRTLVDDFGLHLGCGAHVISLRRTQVGNFNPKEMYTSQALTQTYHDAGFDAINKMLLPLELAVSHLPQVLLNDDMVYYFRKGQAIFVPNIPKEGLVSIKTKAGKFIGIGEVKETSMLAPRRLLTFSYP